MASSSIIWDLELSAIVTFYIASVILSIYTAYTFLRIGLSHLGDPVE